MRASIAWCVIPVPVSPVVAYRSPWSERRLRSLVSPDSWLLRYGASSVGGVSWSFVRVFRRSLLPRSGLRSQWHLRGLVLDPSVSLLRSVSKVCYGLCFVGFWDRSSPSIVSLPLSASGSLCFYHGLGRRVSLSRSSFPWLDFLVPSSPFVLRSGFLALGFPNKIPWS